MDRRAGFDHEYAERERVICEILEGLTDPEVHEFCLQALRDWYAATPNDRFTMHGHLGLFIVPLLAKKTGRTLEDYAYKEPFFYGLYQPRMRGVLEFMWWMQRAGLAMPVLTHDPKAPGYPLEWRLTGAGRRMLGAKTDHPLLPGFLDRVVARCPALPDEVIAHLSDAKACLDHGLLRPAIVLTGLAYECAVEGVLNALVKKGHVQPNALDKKAAQRIDEVKGVVKKALASAEEQFAAIDAYDFAHTLRRRRNDGSHTTPVFPFHEVEEGEELLISAGRHLPALWSLAK